MRKFDLDAKIKAKCQPVSFYYIVPPIPDKTNYFFQVCHSVISANCCPSLLLFVTTSNHLLDGSHHHVIDILNGA